MRPRGGSPPADSARLTWSCPGGRYRARHQPAERRRRVDRGMDMPVPEDNPLAEVVPATPGQTWDCEAYGIPTCFMEAVRPCRSRSECGVRMSAERVHLFERMRQGAANEALPFEQREVFRLLLEDFTDPEQLLGGRLSGEPEIGDDGPSSAV